MRYVLMVAYLSTAVLLQACATQSEPSAAPPRVDANADGAISEAGAAANDDEWVGNVSGDAALTGSIRGVRVSLVAKAPKPLTGAATFTRPALEDHAAASTSDAYRRRSHPLHEAERQQGRKVNHNRRCQRGGNVNGETDEDWWPAADAVGERPEHNLRQAESE